MVLSSAVMIGWLAHLPVLVQLLSRGRAMRFNTALCFFLMGIALIALGRQRIWLPRCLGVAIAVFAAMTGSQDWFGIDLGIDNLFFADHSGVGPNSRGRMVINATICFVISGIGVTSLSFPGGHRFQPLLECLCGSIALANGAKPSALGYLLGARLSMVGRQPRHGTAYSDLVHVRRVRSNRIGFGTPTSLVIGFAVRWLPLPFALCAATVALALCQAIILDEKKQEVIRRRPGLRNSPRRSPGVAVAGSKLRTNGQPLGNIRSAKAATLGGRREAVLVALL